MQQNNAGGFSGTHMLKVKGKVKVGKPEAELVKLEIADAVDKGKASCVIKRQLTQAFEGGKASRNVLHALAVVQPQDLKV